MEMIKSVLIKNMKALRKERGWNQDHLAEKAGYSTGFIKDIERGKSWVSPEAIEKISEAFGVTYQTLFSSDEKDQLFEMPMSKLLKRLAVIPDEVYDLASSFSHSDEVWEDVIGALEAAIETKKAKAQSGKKIG